MTDTATAVAVTSNTSRSIAPARRGSRLCRAALSDSRARRSSCSMRWELLVAREAACSWEELDWGGASTLVGCATGGSQGRIARQREEGPAESIALADGNRRDFASFLRLVQDAGADSDCAAGRAAPAERPQSGAHRLPDRKLHAPHRSRPPVPNLQRAAPAAVESHQRDHHERLGAQIRPYADALAGHADDQCSSGATRPCSCTSGSSPTPTCRCSWPTRTAHGKSFRTRCAHSSARALLSLRR